MWSGMGCTECVRVLKGMAESGICGWGKEVWGMEWYGMCGEEWELT